ncbi:MAG: alpha/beta fold hydrolase [Ectothiorhodospiraceae bacterium]|nr:alpha/beta fold hydrolase [Ectothiorhodospiraceae bacterium]
MTEATNAWLAGLRAAAARQPVPRGTLARHQLTRSGPFRLDRYGGEPPGDRPPVLLVYSLVNRPDLLDLSPDRSLVRDLQAAGFPVYLVDWGYPVLADGTLDLEDYVCGFLRRAVTAVETDAGRAPMVVGICQGATLALMLAAHRPDGIPALATVAAPVDFHAGNGQLARLARTWPLPTDAAAPGLVSGHRLSAGFTALRPADLLLRRYLPLPELARDPAKLDEFLRMEAWMYDCPDQPAPMFHRFLREGYLENRLIAGTMRLADEPLRLTAVRCPVLNVYARDDHLVPVESSQALEGALSTDAPYRSLALRGGHLGLFLSRGTRSRVVDAISEHAMTHLSP